MSINQTVVAECLHIGFFGCRNAGKSSVVNAVTGQSLSVVSDVRGTTTDPVQKAMELLPIGRVVIIDTPGIDDEGALGELRVEKTNAVISKTDIAVIVIDASVGVTEWDIKLKKLLTERRVPIITAYNKADTLAERHVLSDGEIYVSAKTRENITELKEMIAAIGKKEEKTKPIVSDLLSKDDIVVLVTPIDEAAPKGRLILPQQQTIRDLLDAHIPVIVCQDTDLQRTLSMLNQKPKMVITDSQAFGRVSQIVPRDIYLTSFSILFARYKGDLETLVKGAAVLSRLKCDDRVLISEGCTHHRQCGDIGTVKMPAWIEKFSGVKPECSFTSGGEFPDDLSDYSLIVHCGGCMLNEREMKSRMERAKQSGVPIVNYGVAIACMHGILKRSLEPFPHILSMI